MNPRDLHPWDRNPRKNGAAVEPVARSIAKVGFGSPLVVRREGMTIICGHTRHAAALSLGLDRIPVRIMDITEDQAMALAIADNKLGEMAEWDDALLAEHFRSLADDHGWDLGGLEMTGFFSADLVALGAGPRVPGVPGEDEWAHGMGGIPGQDRTPFQQVTFTLHDSQVLLVKEALAAAKATGPFDGSPNMNSNGNALARMAERFLASTKGE